MYYILYCHSSSLAKRNKNGLNPFREMEREKWVVIRSYCVISNTSILHISSTLSLSDSCTVDPLYLLSQTISPKYSFLLLNLLLIIFVFAQHQ